jgi:hypothetical protein
MCEIYGRQRKWPNVLEHGRRALEEAPSDANTLAWMVVAYTDVPEPDWVSAEDFARRAFTIGVRETPVVLALLAAYARRAEKDATQWPRVIEYASLLCELETTSAVWPTIRAYALVQGGELDAAMQSLDLAMLRDPQYPPANLMRGLLLEDAFANPAEARKAYNAYLNIVLTDAQVEAWRDRLPPE